MSQNKLDQIKNKVRQGGNSSAPAHFLEANIIEDDQKAITTPIQQKLDEYVNVDVNVNPTRRTKRKLFEETHTRKTFWIRNDLVERVNEEISGERGAMTQIVNELLEEYFKNRTD